jgi:serine/threonine protein kinase
MSEEISDNSYPQEITSYKPIRIIGRGSFGSLYEAIVLSGEHKDEHVAVKEIKFDNFDEKKYTNFNVRLIYILIII